MIKPAIVLIGEDAPSAVCASLESLGFLVIRLPGDPRLQRPVRSHADMLVFNAGNTVYCDNEYLAVNKDIFQAIMCYGYIVVACEAKISAEYPNDIAFNVAKVGNIIYSNSEYTAKEILGSGLIAVDVKQGYAKCSTVILGDSAAITADTGILSAMKSNGIRVLKIQNSPEAVYINGYNYGFLGGACGVFENKIYFSGNITLHPNYGDMLRFCASEGFELISLSEDKLTDVGGIIFLPFIN